MELITRWPRVQGSSPGCSIFLIGICNSFQELRDPTACAQSPFTLRIVAFSEESLFQKIDDIQEFRGLIHILAGNHYPCS